MQTLRNRVSTPGSSLPAGWLYQLAGVVLRQGAILGLLLVGIRNKSSNAKSLDDVLRHLYRSSLKGAITRQRIFKDSRDDGRFEPILLFSMFAQEELDYNASLSAAGIKLDRGIRTEEGHPLSVVTLVLIPARRIVWSFDVCMLDHLLMSRV